MGRPRFDRDEILVYLIRELRFSTIGGLMKEHMKYLWITCLSALINGCGSSQDPPVAEIGPHQITAGSLRAFVAEWPESLPNQKTGDDARRHYLQIMIDARLLLMEARALGLDTTQAARSTIQGAVDNRVRALYQAREITAKIEIREDEIRAYFDAEGYGLERKVSGILVEGQAAVDTVLAQLRAGRSFAAVAAAHSLDARSARQGGELGFIGRDMAPRIHIPPEVFRSLPLGEISEPLYTGKYWNIVRFIEERPVSYDKYRDAIKNGSSTNGLPRQKRNISNCSGTPLRCSCKKMPCSS